MYLMNMPNLREAYVDVVSSDILQYDGYCDGFLCKEESSNFLGLLLKDSPNLRILDISVVKDHGTDERNGMSLQTLKWSRYFGRQQDRDIAVYILKNARHLKTATILADTDEHDVPNLQMIKELALSPRASVICQLVYIC
ncbi:putative FBD domain-containing protein [Arabidopsis thaliana]